MSDPIIEAAARAMWREEWGTAAWPPAEDPEGAGAYRALARAAFPVIEAAVLEEAIRVTEKHFVGIFTGWVGHAPITLKEAETVAAECSLLCAADIRALKEQP